MTARERHALTEAAIDSVVADAARPFRFIYVDIESPDWLRVALAERAEEWGLEVIRIDEPLWPQQARQRVIDQVTTEYVVFMDNDVQVEPGWLDKLVACADETGAGVVGPLYLIGDGLRTPLIHMAGGGLVESATPEGRVLEDVHRLANEDPAVVAATLTRQPCDFVEFHCMLLRTELARAAIDSSIRCVHEHIDVSLSARERGLRTFVEPAARISYLGLADYMLDDLAFFRDRWSSAESEASIRRFCEKWNVLDDARAFAGVRRFVVDHVAQVDPLRPALRDDALLRAPMRAGDLCQTRSALLDLAAARDYTRDELAFIATAYHIAHVLLDGGYRPCGRPFINHLAGTASVLVHYGFRAEIVAAGLLHSAYTHCPPHTAGKKAAVDAVCATLGGQGSALEHRVRAYTLRAFENGSQVAGPEPTTLSIDDAELLAIEAANELDMYLSGEVRYCGRVDTLDAGRLTLIAYVSRALGVDGLQASLEQAHAAHEVGPQDFVSNVQFSYRIGADRRSAVPMASSAREALMP
jgi:glycosyltransferase involved in cell wall biosynthesis